MKKFLLVAAVAFGILSTNAQDANNTLASSKFTDNWSLGIKGGMVTPMKNHAFFGCSRGIVGAELRKQITPVFGLGLEGEWMVNTSYSTNSYAFDHSYVGIMGTANLMNLFGGYKGSPRFFEIETVLSAGWLHAYVSQWTPVAGDSYGWDKNAFATKAGLNFNFNLGKAKEWTISLKPAILWDMDGLYTSTRQSQNDINKAGFELQAGVTYHFKTAMALTTLLLPVSTTRLKLTVSTPKSTLSVPNLNLATLPMPLATKMLPVSMPKLHNLKPTSLLAKPANLRFS